MHECYYYLGDSTLLLLQCGLLSGVDSYAFMSVVDSMGTQASLSIVSIVIVMMLVTSVFISFFLCCEGLQNGLKLC